MDNQIAVFDVQKAKEAESDITNKNSGLVALSSNNIFNIMDLRFSPDSRLVCVAAEHELAIFTIESRLKIMRCYIQTKP